MLHINKLILEREHRKHVIKNDVSLRHIDTDSSEITDTYIDFLPHQLLCPGHDDIDEPVRQSTLRICNLHSLGRITDHILHTGHSRLRIQHNTCSPADRRPLPECLSIRSNILPPLERTYSLSNIILRRRSRPSPAPIHLHMPPLILLPHSTNATQRCH